MIVQADEFLHAAKSTPDWEERYHYNLADKKTKTFWYADISVQKPEKCIEEWGFYSPAISTNECVNGTQQIKDGLKTVGGKAVKIKIAKDSSTVSFKNKAYSGEFTVTPVFAPFDFPLSPGRPQDARREELESLLWRRFSQRCRFSGIISPKNGPDKKIEAYGQRVHSWGGMLFKRITASSYYQIQFKDLSINLSYLNFGGTLVSNGFISRRSGNIPVIDIELEHLELGRNKIFAGSEISYLDSQDDKDLIVSKTLRPFETAEIKFGTSKFIHVRGFSEFSIIGANKKGIGFEEHFIHPDSLQRFCSGK